MKSVDTETIGLDAFHGSKPFMVTIFDGTENRYWEWDVNPYTRQPIVPPEDVAEINDELEDEELIFQNSKFDIRMLSTVGISNTQGGDWDWSRTQDTTILSHMAESSKPKDLTYSCLFYIGVDIGIYQKALGEECNTARRLARTQFPDWVIAHKELPDNPSIKGGKYIWYNDLWLPRALAKELEYPEDHKWWTILSDYGNVDSEATYRLYEAQKQLIEERGQWRIYEERMKVLPVAYRIEEKGVTFSAKKCKALTKEYTSRSMKLGNSCRRIARSYDYELTLPKSGNNDSLIKFVFEEMKLSPHSVSKKTGKPSLSAATLDHYIDTLEHGTKPQKFAADLREKRKLDTAKGYLESYTRFCLDTEIPDWYILHPSINPTGTATLRWSSNNPNEQNISKKEGVNLRRAFGPAPGREWWSLDYNNLELRIPAYECEEPAMLELFEKPNDAPYFGSYHLLIFSLLYPDLFKKYGAEVKDRYKSTLYQWTKNGNFAELYGAVDTNDGKSTADRAFHYPGAQALVASKLKEKAKLNAYWIDHANRYGYVYTMPDSSVDPNQGYRLYCRKNNWGKISPTLPLNYRVQGTACWLISQAMVEVDEYLSSFQDYYMIMQVHDEIVLDFPFKANKGNLPKVRKVKKIMENRGNYIGVPLTVGIDYHEHDWGTSA